MDRKPAGIIILAILSFLSSLYFLSGVFFTHASLSFIRGISSNRLSLDNFGAGAIIFNLAFFGYHLAIGVGILMFKNWARILYLVNAWFSTIIFSIAGLISLVLVFITGPVSLLLFLIFAIFTTIFIFILRYLYKPEIANLFSLSAFNKSDSYSIPSQFGEIDTTTGELNNEDFNDPTVSHINVAPTVNKSKSERKTELLESQPSVIAMLFKDMGNGRYKHFEITKKRTNIGRSTENDIVISDDATVGRQHAQISFRQGKFWIHDLASTNGTFVNGKKIDKHDLIEGDEIQIGKNTFIFKSLNV